MKRSFTLSALILFSMMLFPPRQAGAQAPDRMSYQAVIRNAASELVTGQEVGMQISILQGSPEGSAVYIETQAPVTSANGLVSIEIGGDDATIHSGDFAAIDWSAGPYFIKTETDPAGGTDYTITGTSQLLSVPYAFHARTAEDITGEITESRITDLQDYLLSETDPVFTSWDRSTGIEITESQVSDLQDYLTSEADPLFMESAAGGITEADTAAWNNKSDFSGDYHSLTNTPDIADSIDIYGFSGNYDDLAGAPGLATVATSGDYADLENKPLKIGDLELDASLKTISNLADPQDDLDAVNRAYVDDLIYQVMNSFARGNEEFSSTTTGTLTDIDGNSYRIIKIGSQWWMAENLLVSGYLNGDPIPTGLDDSEWASTGGGAYVIYPYNEIEGLESDNEVLAAYGKLYNWYAVTDNRGLCPDGWHVPADNEWTELITFIGGTDIGNKLKSCRQVNSPLGGECATTEHPRFNQHTQYGTDNYDFSTLPGGIRVASGGFHHIGLYGFWWSITDESDTNAWYRLMGYNYSDVIKQNDKKNTGFSVRCIRN